MVFPEGPWTRREMELVSHLSPAHTPDRDGPSWLQKMGFIPPAFHLVFWTFPFNCGERWKGLEGHWPSLQIGVISKDYKANHGDNFSSFLDQWDEPNLSHKVLMSSKEAADAGGRSQGPIISTYTTKKWKIKKMRLKHYLVFCFPTYKAQIFPGNIFFHG